MVALLREFPGVRVTFNLVPSLLVQLEAFAANRARDRYLDLGLKPAAHLTEQDIAFILQNFFHAQRTRMIDVYPRYAELLARRGPMATPAERAGGRAAVQRRRPARPAGLAEAGVARSVLSRWGCPGAGAGREGAAVQRRGQAAAAGRRARAAERRDSRLPRGCRARPGRAVHLAVLPSDPAPSVRHRRLQADPSGVGHAPPAVSAPGGRVRATDPRRGLPRAAVRTPAGRAVAVRRVGVGRDGAARREGRLPFGWRPTN